MNRNCPERYEEEDGHLPHVRRWLDRWNKLEANVNKADYANQGPGNDAQDVVV